MSKFGEIWAAGLNRGMREAREHPDYDDPKWIRLRPGQKGLPDKFPKGTTFFYCDWTPSARLPDGTYWIFDPDPREIPLESAIPTLPAIVTEARFRELNARFNEELRADKERRPPIPAGKVGHGV